MTSKYSSLPILKAYGQVTVATEDGVIQAALDWAEAEIERRCGSQFNQATVSNEVPARGWINRAGIATLVALERGPITAVSSIQYRSLSLGSSWTSLSWDADGLILPPASSPPHPRAWTVTVIPQSSSIADVISFAADNVVFKWTYTGGYSAIPDGLVQIVNRLAWWKYKLREAPLGRVSSPPFGVTEVIPAMPADIGADLMLWSKVVLG